MNVYEIITERILAEIDKGTLPWHKPWKSELGEESANLVSKKAYRGITQLDTPTPSVGNYVVPDGWPSGIGGLLVDGIDPVDASFIGSKFCITGGNHTYPVNITITGRTLRFDNRFSRPYMRIRIEWVHDGKVSTYSPGYIVFNS